MSKGENSKVSMADLASQIRNTFKDKEQSKIVCTGAEIPRLEKKDFIILPEWWKEVTGLWGLPYGYIFMIAGNKDSGKTAVSIEIIKTAQKQGVYVVLVDTEKKTDRDRLTFHGVKDDELAVIRPSYLEEAYDGIDKWIDAINASDPEAKILVVFDSLGNTPSKKEKDTQLDSTHQLGVAAKVNKLALRRLTPQLGKNNVHFLVINQTYQNMGSFGRSNSGGQAVDFAAAVIYQTSRAAWLEKGTGANTKRVGAQVKWTLYKSQLGFKKEGFIKSFKLNLTNDGVALVKDRKEKEDE